MSKSAPRFTNYRRIIQLLVTLVIVPGVLLSAVGVILLVIGEAKFNLLMGILILTFTGTLVTGVILAWVFLARERQLNELQADGRITNVELARRVGISAPPCLRRVRALEEAGFIKGYRALLDEKLLGYEVTVFAMVHLTSQAEPDLKEFEDFVRKEPLVRECWMLSGEIDFVLKCVAPDLKTFQAFVAELTGAPHVRNVKTSLTLRTSKDAAMVPMELKGKA